MMIFQKKLIFFLKKPILKDNVFVGLVNGLFVILVKDWWLIKRNSLNFDFPSKLSCKLIRLRSTVKKISHSSIAPIKYHCDNVKEVKYPLEMDFIKKLTEDK